MQRIPSSTTNNTYGELMTIFYGLSLARNNGCTYLCSSTLIQKLLLISSLSLPISIIVMPQWLLTSEGC